MRVPRRCSARACREVSRLPSLPARAIPATLQIPGAAGPPGRSSQIERPPAPLPAPAAIERRNPDGAPPRCCLLYTSDAADEEDSVDLGGRRIIKKKKH